MFIGLGAKTGHYSIVELCAIDVMISFVLSAGVAGYFNEKTSNDARQGHVKRRRVKRKYTKLVVDQFWLNCI